MTTPFLIGVCGDSGSGKSLFVENLIKILGEDQTLVLHGDSYHKWPRGAEEWTYFTHLNPKANHLNLAAEHLSALKKNKPIHSLHYDHHTGQFTGPFRHEPHKYIIFEGLHTFFTQELRDLMDFKIFINVDHDLITHFKIHRDMKERGYSKEKILETIKKRKPDSKKYITPQKKHADLVIQKKSLIPLKEGKKETAVEFTFIHQRPVNLLPLKKLLQTIFPQKIGFNLRSHRPRAKINTILSKKELATLVDFTQKKFAIELNGTTMGLCQFITAYNLHTYGQTIGGLSYPHR